MGRPPDDQVALLQSRLSGVEQNKLNESGHSGSNFGFLKGKRPWSEVGRYACC
jgi:hypothetical protein